MVYNILSWVILAIEVAVIITFIVLWKKKGESSLAEKGLYLIPSAVILYALYAMGVFYGASHGGEPLSIYAFVNIIKCCYEVFIACVSTQNSALMLFSTPYSVAFLIGVLLAFATFIALMVSVVKFFFYRTFRARALLKKGCDILIGHSEMAELYMGSYENCLLLLTTPPSVDFRKELREKKIAYVYCDLSLNALKNRFKGSANSGKDFHFISLESGESALKTVAVFKRLVNSLSTTNFYLYVKFDYRNYISINESVLQDKTYTAYISCFNEHELMARKFVENYPITRFAPKEFFDYEKGTIAENKTFNVFYLGFGDSLSAIHRASVMNDQLATTVNGKIAPFIINYYAYDKIERANENKNVHFYENRFFKRLEKFESEEYFDTPKQIENSVFVPFDLDHKDGDLHFKKTILENKDNYNAVLISYGNSVENIDYALKTVMYFRQNDIENYHVFVKVDNYQAEYADFFNEKVSFFGAGSFVFNHEVIVDETLTAKAKSVNASYQEKKKAISKWTELSAIKKTSNLYAGLNLRLKLNMLGYDLKTASEGGVYSPEIMNEVISALEKGMPSGKDYKEYLFENKKGFNACNAIAFQEKLRWNAFYIVNGFIPMKKSKIEYKNGAVVKDDDNKKLHACITTVWGLDEYHKLVASLYEKNEGLDKKSALEKANTYIYDYSVIDVVKGLNEKNKHFITRK